MPQHIKKGANALVAEALDGLPAISVEEAIPLVDAGTHVFVDVREGSEHAKGVINGAVVSSRGLLEFHIDPDSPAHKPELASNRPLFFTVPQVAGPPLLPRWRARWAWDQWSI